MDLRYSQTNDGWMGVGCGLNPLWIYTTLKLTFIAPNINDCLNPLWIYTTLKPGKSGCVAARV